MTNFADEQPIDKETLQKYMERGLTQEQMIEQFFEDYGVRRSRSSFAVAASRFGMASLRRVPRYTETLPWRVKLDHSMAYPARMLRLLGRRLRDEPLPELDEKNLDSWLEKLDQDGAVIHYDPDTEEGFWRVPKGPDDVNYIRNVEDAS